VCGHNHLQPYSVSPTPPARHESFDHLFAVSQTSALYDTYDLTPPTAYILTGPSPRNSLLRTRKSYRELPYRPRPPPRVYAPYSPPRSITHTCSPPCLDTQDSSTTTTTARRHRSSSSNSTTAGSLSKAMERRHHRATEQRECWRGTWRPGWQADRATDHHSRGTGSSSTAAISQRLPHSNMGTSR
jgi:hypothetical protein